MFKVTVRFELLNRSCGPPSSLDNTRFSTKWLGHWIDRLVLRPLRTFRLGYLGFSGRFGSLGVFLVLTLTYSLTSVDSTAFVFHATTTTRLTRRRKPLWKLIAIRTLLESFRQQSKSSRNGPTVSLMQSSYNVGILNRETAALLPKC